MLRKAAIGVALGLVAFSASAGKPPMFKPDMPASWTYQQKQLANHALDVLFDTCPAISSYLQHDIQSAALHMEDMSSPANAQTAPPFWGKHRWHQVLRLDLVTVQSPSNAQLAQDAGKAGLTVNFYMGSGTDAGIYFESDQHALCGASNSVAVLRPGDASIHMPDAYDTFVPAPSMKLLDRF